MKLSFLYLLLGIFVLNSCEKKEEIQNPFATPEGCVKEFIEARDSCDIVRMLKCYSYEPRFESQLIKSIQNNIDNHSKGSDEIYITDSVKLIKEYPNSAVVRVYYRSGQKNEEPTPWEYDINLVKDSTNWKLETHITLTIKSY